MSIVGMRKPKIPWSYGLRSAYQPLTEDDCGMTTSKRSFKCAQRNLRHYYFVHHNFTWTTGREAGD